MQRNLFRKNAMLKLVSPLDLDRMMTVTKPKSWLLMLSLGLVVILLVTWGCFGIIYERVSGGGIIVTQSGIETVYAPANGQIMSLDVERGDRVWRGDLIGTIIIPEALEDIRQIYDKLEILRKNREEIIKFNQNIRSARKEQFEVSSNSLEKAMAQLKEQIEWQKEFNKNVQRLKDTGAVADKDWAVYKENLDTKLSSVSKYFTELQNSKTELLEKNITISRELLEVDINIKNLAGELASKLNLYRTHSRIVSNDSGYVTDVLVSPGKIVQLNAPLANLRGNRNDDSSIWEVYAYFSLADGKKIEPGMSVIVTPSTVKAEKDGSVRGVVSSVSEYSLSREAVNAIYHNDAYVEGIMKQTSNMPVEVRIVLLLDSSSPSGFRWTSGKGPDLRLTEGTMCVANVAVKQEAPINLIFSKARQIVTGRGIVEEQMRKAFEKKGEGE